MHVRHRLELIIERMAARRACNILEAAGLSGYTVLPALSGYGGGNRWSRDADISAAGDMLVIVSVGSTDAVETALARLEALLSAHIGVLNVSEVKVLRPERF